MNVVPKLSWMRGPVVGLRSSGGATRTFKRRVVFSCNSSNYARQNLPRPRRMSLLIPHNKCAKTHMNRPLGSRYFVSSTQGHFLPLERVSSEVGSVSGELSPVIQNSDYAGGKEKKSAFASGDERKLSILQFSQKDANNGQISFTSVSNLDDWWRWHRIGVGSERKVDAQFKKLCKENVGNMNNFYDTLVFCKSSKHMRLLIQEMKAAVRKARQELHGKTNQRIEKVFPYPSAKAYGKLLRRLLLEGDYKGADKVWKNLKAKKYGIEPDNKSIRELEGVLKESIRSHKKLDMRRLAHLRRMLDSYKKMSDPDVRADAWHFVEAMASNRIRHELFYECMVKFCETSEQMNDVIWEMTNKKKIRSYDFEHEWSSRESLTASAASKQGKNTLHQSCDTARTALENRIAKRTSFHNNGQNWMCQVSDATRSQHIRSRIIGKGGKNLQAISKDAGDDCEIFWKDYRNGGMRHRGYGDVHKKESTRNTTHGAFIIRAKSQCAVIQAAMSIYDKARKVRRNLMEQSANETTRGLMMNKEAVYEEAVVEAQRVAINGFAACGLSGLTDGNTEKSTSSYAPIPQNSVRLRIYRHVVRQHILEGHVASAVHLADKHLRFKDPSDLNQESKYDTETDSILKLALNDDALDRERVNHMAGHLTWHRETGDPHAMQALLDFFGKIISKCESIGPSVYCERLSLMDSSEEMFLFVEDMHSIGVEAPIEAFLIIMKMLMIEGNLEAAFGVFRQNISNRIATRHCKDRFEEKLRNLHDQCVDILLEGTPRTENKLSRRDSVDARMLRLEELRTSHLRRFHDNFLRWGCIESRDSAVKLFKSMQENSAAVASHYLIMMQALRNGVIGVGKGSEDMQSLIWSMHDSHANYINEEEVVDAALEALEDEDGGNVIQSEFLTLDDEIDSGSLNSNHVFQTMSAYSKWMQQNKDKKRKNTDAGNMCTDSMATTPDKSCTETTDTINDVFKGQIGKGTTLPPRDLAYIQAKKELESDELLRVMPDTNFASDPMEIWRDIPRPILSPVRADQKVAEMYRLLHEQYIIEGDMEGAESTRLQWMELNGGIDTIQDFEKSEIQDLRLDLLNSYLALLEKGNTAQDDIRKGVFALYALWQERGLTNTALSNTTLQFCRTPAEMHSMVLDGMKRRSKEQSEHEDSPDETTFELLVMKIAEIDGAHSAMDLISNLRRDKVKLSNKVHDFARREAYRKERAKRRKQRKLARKELRGNEPKAN